MNADLTILRKELYAGAHRLSAYYLSRAVSMLPFLFAESTLMTIIIYVLSQFRYGSPAQFCLLMLIIWMSISLFLAFGTLIATSLPAPAQFPVMFIFISFFWGWSGFFRPLSSMPVFLRILSRANPVVYICQLAWHVTVSWFR